MKIKNVISYLDQIAPPHIQEGYDNSGLQVGDPERELTGILCCLDSTERVIEEAVRKGCNLVIAHHPLLFHAIKQISTRHYVERTITLAIKNDIAIFAAHTNLDKVLHNGVNEVIAVRLGLENLVPVELHESEPAIGFGVKGKLAKAMDEEFFIDHLKDRLQTQIVRHSPLLGHPVREIAVCGGSGSFLISSAIESGVQAYITSDLKYHDFFEADNKLILCDVGHYESEQFTAELLHRLIKEKFTNFAAYLSKVISNPVNYK